MPCTRPPFRLGRSPRESRSQAAPARFVRRVACEISGPSAGISSVGGVVRSSAIAPLASGSVSPRSPTVGSPIWTVVAAGLGAGNSRVRLGSRCSFIVGLQSEG